MNIVSPGFTTDITLCKSDLYQIDAGMFIYYTMKDIVSSLKSSIPLIHTQLSGHSFHMPKSHIIKTIVQC